MQHFDKNSQVRIFQPSVIDKELDLNLKNLIKSNDVKRWREILSTFCVTSISAKNTSFSTFFGVPFLTTFRWRVFLKPTGVDS